MPMPAKKGAFNLQVHLPQNNIPNPQHGSPTGSDLHERSKPGVDNGRLTQSLKRSAWQLQCLDSHSFNLIAWEDSPPMDVMISCQCRCQQSGMKDVLPPQNRSRKHLFMGLTCVIFRHSSAISKMNQTHSSLQGQLLRQCPRRSHQPPLALTSSKIRWDTHTGGTLI